MEIQQNSNRSTLLEGSFVLMRVVKVIAHDILSTFHYCWQIDSFVCNDIFKVVADSFVPFCVCTIQNRMLHLQSRYTTYYYFQLCNGCCFHDTSGAVGDNRRQESRGSDYFAPAGVTHIAQSLHLIYLCPALLMFCNVFAFSFSPFTFCDRLSFSEI